MSINTVLPEDTAAFLSEVAVTPNHIVAPAPESASH